MKYRVEVAAPLPDDLEGAADRVAAGFGIPAERVMALLRRAPGIVTKPIDAAEAGRVVKAFAEVGIVGRMLPYDPAAPTVLDSVLDAAGSEPARSMQRRRSSTPPAPAVLPPVESADALPTVSPEALAAAIDTALPTGPVEAVTVETTPPPHAQPPETLAEAPVPAPSAGRRPAIVPRLDDGHDLETGDLDDLDLDLTDPGLGERSRRIYAALDAAVERAEAEQAAAAAEAAAAEAALEEEPPLIVARDLDDLDGGAEAADGGSEAVAAPAAPEVEERPDPPEADSGPEATVEQAVVEADAPPPPDPAATGDDDGFDADAFTRALLDEHGLDDSLLDGVESEAEVFDLRDRAERLTVDEGVGSESSSQQRSPFLSRVEEPAVGERGAVAVPIGLDSDDPQALPRETDPGRRRSPRPRRRTGLRSKVLLAGLFPALLTAVFALAAVALTVRPLLQGQDGGAASAASAFAAALSTRQVDAALDSAAAAAELQRAAMLARATLVGEGIELLLVTDPTGAPLAGWSLTSVDPLEVAQGAAPLVAPALAALGLSADATASELPARVAAVPIQVGGSAVGAVLAVETAPAGGAALRNLLLILLAAVAIPLLIAFVVAGALTGSLLRNLESLTRAADRISRGKLGRPVELDTGDELSDLAKAIERMRISLEEGMERLRRRRQ